MPEPANPPIPDRRSRETRIHANILAKQAHRPAVNANGGIVGDPNPYTEDAVGNYIGPASQGKAT